LQYVALQNILFMQADCDTADHIGIPFSIGLPIIFLSKPKCSRFLSLNQSEINVTISFITSRHSKRNTFNHKGRSAHKTPITDFAHISKNVCRKAAVSLTHDRAFDQPGKLLA
jgi:hypothetical protein